MWTYRAAILAVLDGDTVRALIDTGFHGRQEEDLRLAGVWAPESHQPGGEQAAGVVRGWVAALDPRLRWPVEIVTSLNKRLEPDERRTFTRYVVEIRSIASGASLNEAVRSFLVGHPEWGTGVGAAPARGAVSP